MGLKQLTPPVSEPVNVAELRSFCRQDLLDDDAELADLAFSCREFIERSFNIQMLTATWELTLDAFPEGVIYLPRPPLASVTSIQYYDSANVLQTWSNTNYRVLTTEEPGFIEAVDSWPNTYERSDAVKVTYVAGWSHRTLIPAGLTQAIKTRVRWMYEGQPGDPDKHERRISSLLGPYGRKAVG